MITEDTIIYLNPRDILPSQHNVRSDPGDLAGLAETIREHGILQPLGVTRERDDFRVVFGNRRRDAAIVVGLDRVPCVLVEAAGEQEVIVQQVLENLQRLELNDLDQSRAFQAMLNALTKDGTPQGEALDQIAHTLGLSTRQIRRYLRLQSLAPKTQKLLARGELGVTHAQHLVQVTPPQRQEAAALLAVEEDLTAAELAKLCNRLEHNRNITPQAAWQLLRQGRRVPVIESRTTGPAPTSSVAAPQPEMREHDALEGDRQEVDGYSDVSDPPWKQPEEESFSRLEPVTRDGNRVRRIHSVDSFLDEVQRLTRCVQEGRFTSLLEEDPGAGTKLKLAARQLRFLAQAVTDLERKAQRNVR